VAVYAASGNVDLRRLISAIFAGVTREILE
jgi:hypothetical protein